MASALPSRQQTSPGATEKIRIDKWLWAARFFKTRSLASEAIKGGKIAVNGQRSKPSREVVIGDSISLRQGFEQKIVIVRGISARRGPATEAQRLYEETAQSMESRAKEKSLRQLASNQRPRGEGRPTKRDRRQIERLVRD